MRLGRGHHRRVPEDDPAQDLQGRSQEARPGPITSLHDKAPCYQSVVGEKAFCGFDDIELTLAAGKAPDMSHLDAGVCPLMGGNFYDEYYVKVAHVV